MKLIVVGAHGTTRELLRRLGERWDVVVVDTDQQRLQQAAAVRHVETMDGDGSSRLVLKRAGLEEADALVASTDDDDVNLQAIEYARDAGVVRVVAVASDPDRVDEYRTLGVPVYAPSSLTARHVELGLEPRRIASTAFADGKAEAIEFVVSPDSPVRDKRLRDLHSDTWVVAAVLRGDQLIIPHGNTRIEVDDRVTIVGAAADFATIVRTFTSGQSRFPLNFGRRVAVALESEQDLDTTISEAVSFVRNSQAESLLVLHADEERDEARAAEIEGWVETIRDSAKGVEIEFRAVPALPSKALATLATTENIGLIVLKAPTGGELVGRLQTSRMVRDFAPLGVPLLLSRGSHPYSSILVPARRTQTGEAAGRAGIDLTVVSGGTLRGVAVVPPNFVSSPDEVERARRAMAWLRDEAAVQGVAMKRGLKRGNPVRVMEELAKTASLLAIGMPDSPAGFLLRPGIGGHLLRRVNCSVLLVPPRS